MSISLDIPGQSPYRDSGAPSRDAETAPAPLPSGRGPSAPSPSVGCVIMASGLGTRFGGNKLLCDLHGKPLISHILDTAESVSLFRILTVTRHREVARLCAQKDVECLLHSLPGQNDTIRLGLLRLLGFPHMAGCLFCPADQPLVSQESLRELFYAFCRSPRQICRLGYGDRTGAPVLFGRRFFPELLSLPPEKGGSFLMKKYPGQVIVVPARDEFELYDADTPKELAALSHILSAGNRRGD